MTPTVGGVQDETPSEDATTPADAPMTAAAAPPAPPVSPAPAMPAKRSPVVPVLAVLLVAALVAVALLWKQSSSLKDDRDLADAATSASAVAEKVITRMTTYDYATVDQDFSWVDEVGTASFEKEQKATAAQLVPIIKKSKAQATGKVLKRSATAQDADHVTVLLFVDQVLGRAGSKQSNVDRTRVQMSMVRGGPDGWLVNDIQLY